MGSNFHYAVRIASKVLKLYNAAALLHLFSLYSEWGNYIPNVYDFYPIYMVIIEQGYINLSCY